MLVCLFEGINERLFSSQMDDFELFGAFREPAMRNVFLGVFLALLAHDGLIYVLHLLAHR